MNLLKWCTAESVEVVHCWICWSGALLNMLKWCTAEYVEVLHCWICWSGALLNLLTYYTAESVEVFPCWICWSITLLNMLKWCTAESVEVVHCWICWHNECVDVSVKSFSHALVSLRNVQALLHFQRYGQGGEGGSELNWGTLGWWCLL